MVTVAGAGGLLHPSEGERLASSFIQPFLMEPGFLWGIWNKTVLSESRLCCWVLWLDTEDFSPMLFA